MSTYVVGFGSFYGVGADENAVKPKKLKNLQSVTLSQLECGSRHSCAITGSGVITIKYLTNSTDDGQLYTWGSNDHNQVRVE